MLDNFSKEVEVSNLIARYLKENNYSIIQLICPGTQAALSVRYFSKDRNRKIITYPDVIAVKDNTICIGEMKAGFSSSDKKKLLNLKHSIDAEEKIKSLIFRITGLQVDNHKIEYILMHGDSKKLPDPELPQIIVTDSTTILLKASI